MGKVTLYLNKVPADKEAQLKMCDNLYRKLTGKEPTPEDTANSRAALGLPPEAKPGGDHDDDG